MSSLENAGVKDNRPTIVATPRILTPELTEYSNALLLGVIKPEDKFAEKDFSYGGGWDDNGKIQTIAQATKTMSVQMGFEIAKIDVEMSYSRDEMIHVLSQNYNVTDLRFF